MIKISAYLTSKIFGDFYSFNVKILATTIYSLNNLLFADSRAGHNSIFIFLLKIKYAVVVSVATFFIGVKKLLNMVVVYCSPSENYIRKDLLQTFFTFHYLGPLYA